MGIGAPHWTKMLFIHSIMNQPEYSVYDWIVWVDWDTAIIDCSVSILDLIYDHTVTVQSDPESTVSLVFNGDLNAIANNGVFAIRNNEWGQDFMDKVTLMKRSGTNEWANKIGYYDQSIFIAVLMGWDPHEEPNRAAAKAAENLGTRIKMRVSSEENMKRALGAVPDVIREHVAMMPQDLWNSYDRAGDDTFIMHCAGDGKCKRDLLSKHIRDRSNCGQQQA